MIKKIIAMFLTVIVTCGISAVFTRAQVSNITTGVGVKEYGGFTTYNGNNGQGLDSYVYKLYVLLNNNELWQISATDDSINWKSAEKIMDGARHVEAEQGRIFVIKTDNSLWGWGMNSAYELGLGNTDVITKPTKITDNVEEIIPREFNSNLSTVYALKTDHTVWGWGFAVPGAHDKDGTPLPVKIADNAKQVMASGDALWFLSMDNKLYGIGFVNNNIESGGQGFLDSITLLLDDVNIVNGSAIKSDGTVWNTKNPPTKLADSYDEYISHWGVHHIDDAGTLWINAGTKTKNEYGDDNNKYGYFGADVSGIDIVEKPIKILDNVVWHHSGDIHMGLAITKSNELWGWGSSRWLGSFNRKMFPGRSLADEQIYKTPVKIMDNVRSLSDVYGFGYVI